MFGVVDNHIISVTDLQVSLSSNGLPGLNYHIPLSEQRIMSGNLQTKKFHRKFLKVRLVMSNFQSSDFTYPQLKKS